METVNKYKSVTEYFTRYVAYLKEEAPQNSGALASSIQFNQTENEVGIEMLSYGKFLEEGINGTEQSVGSIYSFTNKKPPMSSIEDYAKSIGANPFALQNSLFKNGIRPQVFIKDTLETKLNTFADQYAEAHWEDIKKQLDNE